MQLSKEEEIRATKLVSDINTKVQQALLVNKEMLLEKFHPFKNHRPGFQHGSAWAITSPVDRQRAQTHYRDMGQYRNAEILSCGLLRNEICIEMGQAS